MAHKTKEFNVEYKAEGTGSLEGYASTWIRVPDSYGDVVKQGAFTRTLSERWKGGKGIPLLWAHKMDDLAAFIGTAEANEDEKGLHFVATFDGTEEAQRVRSLYQDGRLSKFSFAYDVREAGPVTLEDGIKANELRDLDLFEISCVCVPADDDAGVVEVKAEEPETKSGRRNSAADEAAIRGAIEALQRVLGEFDDTVEEEPEEEQTEANAAAEEPKEVNQEKLKLLEYIKSMETTEDSNDESEE